MPSETAEDINTPSKRQERDTDRFFLKKMKVINSQIYRAQQTQNMINIIKTILRSIRELLKI